MSRFYVPPEAVNGDTITIRGEEARHITCVMRLKPSDGIVAFDGTGREYDGVIKAVKAKSVVIEIIAERAPSAGRGAAITLIQAIPKKSKMDYIVEKATELGVSAIVPVFTRRTIPEWDGPKRAAQAARWRKIAREASKQCARAEIPAVNEIDDFTKVVKGPARYDLALIATLGDDTVKLGDTLTGACAKTVAIAIGPEGDFTPEEVEASKKSGFRPVSLGSRVLKSDTAGLAALAIIDYELTR